MHSCGTLWFFPSAERVVTSFDEITPKDPAFPQCMRAGGEAGSRFCRLAVGSVGAACGRVCRLPAGAAGLQAAVLQGSAGLLRQAAAGPAGLLQSPHACCRSAGSAGAVLHAGSAERSKQHSPTLRATLKSQGLGA